MAMKVGLDVSGGDFAPDANVLGAILAQKELGERAKICLIGNKDQIYSHPRTRRTSQRLF